MIPRSYSLHGFPLHDSLGGYRLALFPPYQNRKKKKKTNTGRLSLSLQRFSISAPKEPILSFSVTALRLRLLFAFDKVKQPALCYHGEGHLLKVSGLDGFWASKSQSLFSTHHFYRIGEKSDIQIVQRETKRPSSSDPRSAMPALLLGQPYNASFSLLFCRAE